MASATEPQLSLSTSAFSEIWTCLKRYEYHYEVGIVRKPKDTSKKMRLGSWDHALLHSLRLRRSLRVRLAELIEGARERGVLEEDIRAITEDVVRTMNGYQDYWAEKEDVIEPVAIEKTLKAMLGPIEIRATIDNIGRHRGGNWIVEEKTTQNIPGPLWRAVDPQTCLQLFVCEQNGIKIDGIIFDYLCTKVPAVPKIKKDGTFYENVKLTTSQAFAEAEANYRAWWKEKDEVDWATYNAMEDGEKKEEKHRELIARPGERQQYLTMKRAQLVNDAAFYQRYYVFRPDAVIRETLNAALFAAWQVTKAQESGVWPRSLNVLTCSRFCSYGKLCMVELSTGKVSESIRSEDFEIDTGWREGQESWEEEEGE